MTPPHLSIARKTASVWQVTFNNPPNNMFVPATIAELGALMTDLEADPSVKVVVFQSANPDFFIAHLDVGKAAVQPPLARLCAAPLILVRRENRQDSRSHARPR
jgi:enoyl-CoA hydratase/carnithine racemase